MINDTASERHIDGDDDETEKYIRRMSHRRLGLIDMWNNMNHISTLFVHPAARHRSSREIIERCAHARIEAHK